MPPGHLPEPARRRPAVRRHRHRPERRLPPRGAAAGHRHRRRLLVRRQESEQPRVPGGERHLHLLRGEGGDLPRHQSRRGVGRGRDRGARSRPAVRRRQRAAPGRDLPSQPGDGGGPRAGLLGRRGQPAENPGRPPDRQLRRALSERGAVDLRGESGDAGPANGEERPALPYRPERDHRLRQQRRSREFPSVHLSAREHRHVEPRLPEPARAVPGIHGDLPRRDEPDRGVPGLLRGPDPRIHPESGGRRLHDQLRLRRRRIGDHREPARRGPDARLPGLQVRGVLPELLDRERPGDGRRQAGQLRPGAAGARPAGAPRVRRPEGPGGVLPRRSLQRPPRLHQRLREVPQPPRGPEGAPHLPPAYAAVAVQPQRRRLELPRRPGDRPRLGVHLRDRVRRGGEPEQDAGGRHLPLPLLSPLRAGDVGADARPRRLRAGDAARRVGHGRQHDRLPRGAVRPPERQARAAAVVPGAPRRGDRRGDADPGRGAASRQADAAHARTGRGGAGVPRPLRPGQRGPDGHRRHDRPRPQPGVPLLHRRGRRHGGTADLLSRARHGRGQRRHPRRGAPEAHPRRIRRVRRRVRRDVHFGGDAPLLRQDAPAGEAVLLAGGRHRRGEGRHGLPRAEIPPDVHPRRAARPVPHQRRRAYGRRPRGAVRRPVHRRQRRPSGPRRESYPLLRGSQRGAAGVHSDPEPGDGAAVQRGNAAAVQGGRPPARRAVQQDGVALPAAADPLPLGRRGGHPVRGASPGADGPSPQHVRLRGVLAHEPGPGRVQGGRLPDDHAHRRHRAAHPHGEVRRDGVGRRGQRVELRGRHHEPGRGPGADRRDQPVQRRRGAPTPVEPVFRARPRPRRSAASRPDHRPVARCADDGPAMAGGPRRQPARQGPGPGDRLLARPLRAVHAPAGRPVRDRPQRAGAVPMEAQRDGGDALQRTGPRQRERHGRRADELAGGHPESAGPGEPLPRVLPRVQRLPARLRGGGVPRDGRRGEHRAADGHLLPVRHQPHGHGEASSGPTSTRTS